MISMLIYGVQNIQFLARGKRSEVFKGNFKKGKIAIKVYKTADAKIRAVKEILNQCFKLDSLRINKLELNKPKKHILMERNKPKFIDFERCYYTNKPKNLTQICQYLTS